jgi:prephenate dehydrogenase
MAGSQHKGLQHADGTIFRQSLCILTPLPGSPSSATASIAGFWRRLGMTTLTIPASKHDRLVALASHLPQIAASALMGAQSVESLRVAGPGLRDTTRLAASPGDLWAGILLDNQRPVRSAIRAMRSRLDSMDRALARGDRRAIERLFATANANRSRLEHARRA